MSSIVDSYKENLANTHGSSIEVSITSEVNKLLARALREKLYLVQKTESLLTQVQSCAAHYIPATEPGRLGKSIRPCHSKNACFLCTPQEYAVVETRISSLLQLWANQGLVLFLTFNLPYPTEMDLGGRYDSLRMCWELLMKDSRIQRLRNKAGLKYIRVLEESSVAGSWFPHFHVILLIQDEFNTREAFQVHSKQLRTLWTDKAKRIGFGGTLSSVQDSRAFIPGTHERLAGYLTMNGRVGLHLNVELADVHSGSYSPFELFQIYAATGDADAREKWEEFEFFSAGRHRFTYSVAARQDLKSLKTRRSLGRQNSTSRRP